MRHGIHPCTRAHLCVQVALQLYQRALVEHGTNWKNEQIDGFLGFMISFAS